MSNGDLAERRRAYYANLKDACEPHRERASEYDERAIQFAMKALQALTYLNGGGLLAIPIVVALFKSDPLRAKHELILTAVSFVVGLLFIVLAQVCAFFTFARRMEAEHLFEQQQMTQLGADHFATPSEYPQSVTDAQAYGRTAKKNKFGRPGGDVARSYTSGYRSFASYLAVGLVFAPLVGFETYTRDATSSTSSLGNVTRC